MSTVMVSFGNTNWEILHTDDEWQSFHWPSTIKVLILLNVGAEVNILYYLMHTKMLPVLAWNVTIVTFYSSYALTYT